MRTIAVRGYVILVGMTAAFDSTDSIYFGSENALAAGLFHALDRQATSSWQPLILYGDPGSGKSFIALSIANRWPTANDQDVVVTTAADVARLFQPSRLAAELAAESERYRRASLLVIDDIDHLPGRDNACSWLVGVLDFRLSLDLPTIVTCKSMSGLRGLPNRLFSRLAGGLPVHCALPTADTRRTIIQRTIQQECPSTQPVSDASQESWVDSMVDRSSGMSVTGTRNMVTAHKSEAESRSTVPSVVADDFPKRCLSAVARRFGIRVADIKGSSRRKHTVMARSVAMFLIREFTSLSLVDIGQCFQNRDHTTVRHACQKIRRLLTLDQHVQEAVGSVCVSLNRTYDVGWSVSLDDKCA